MTRGPIGERVTAVETKVDNLREQFARHEQHINAKLDQIIAGQKAGADDHASMRQKITDLSDDVKAMKPHVETVAAAKTFWTVAGWVGLKLSMISGAIYGVWSFAQPYIKLPWHR